MATRCRENKQSSIDCARCGGLMVSDFCMDLMNSPGELSLRQSAVCNAAKWIRHPANRQLRQEPTDRQIMSNQSLTANGTP